DAGLAERLEEVRLAGAGRPADDEVLVPVDPLQRAQRPLRGRRDRGQALVPHVESLAGREPGSLAPGPDRGRLPAGELLGEQGAHGLGRFPTLSLGGRQQVGGGVAHVRQAERAQQVDDLVDRCRAHRSPPSWCQAPVPGWREWTSSALRRWPGGLAARIEARSPSAKRPNVAAWPRAQSTRSVPWRRASVTASAIFTFTRLVPAAAASTSQLRAPSPMARNSVSAALVGFGRRASGPSGRGG